MNVGIAYYPEHCEPRRWAVDYRLLADAGITMIRIAEFAWSAMEPSEGQYDWKWLDDSIALAAEYGIGVVLCTPTACPPIWLTEQYPEVLPVHKNGQAVTFGARQHRSYHSPKYLEHSCRIVEKMAERYGAHPNVLAWQLDNEYGGEVKYDFGPCAKQAFHRYLEDRHGTIEALNASWGTIFWSQRYDRFDQIPLPAPIQSDLMMWHHPSLELEFARFSSNGIVEFARAQTRILRKYTGDRPITTNAFMFSWGDNVNWAELFAELDVAGVDIYSGDEYEIAFYCDAARGALARPFWIMEFGASSPELDRKLELVSQRGCSQFFLFKMKPFPWGQEQAQGRGELLTITGEPARNYGVVQQYTRQLDTKKQEAKYQDPQPTGAPGSADPGRSAAKLALYYHFDSSWCYQLSVGDRLHYPDYVVKTVYRSMYEAHDGLIDVLYSADQLGEHEVVVIPLHTIYDAALEERLIAYVHAGGKLVVTADLFRKNQHNVYLAEVPRLFRELLAWQPNNFILDAIDTRQSILIAHEYGAGGTWVVPRDASNEEWLETMAVVLKA
ncbi:beta-galactosidase [Paenibacillus sacheonensis]|uniref:beta-galactosidase n=1 Tax=Paenibacillus sacheonensis TaxID=742054 RepID=A0A7X5BYH3_9BACL|nr:beta-galactosidase [Paenibacillus sacheonensis]MBM7565364.1 beta-galactosidase [Paenibacillus sacheonensis]NBC69707.1 hypothetical protein [Paenibacillus sacheonensis]